MNYYARNINSFLSGVANSMSAVYLPAFFVSLIELLEDYYKFDSTPDKGLISVNRTTIKISYELSTAYFLAFLFRIRNQIPGIKMAPYKGKTHDQRFLGDDGEPGKLVTPGKVLESGQFAANYTRVLGSMRDTQNIYPVFEKRSQLVQLNNGYMTMDVVAADTLLQNSILYTKMAEFLIYQYLNKLAANSCYREQLENFFFRGDGRVNFPVVARQYVIEYQENRCFYCNRTLESRTQNLKPRADHFVPWVFVKNSSVENLVFACNDCNSSKSDRLAAIQFFNRLLLRNSDGSDFWRRYPDELLDINERIERWSRNYYLASEQLSTGWTPEILTA